MSQPTQQPERPYEPNALQALDEELHARLAKGERFVRIADVFRLLYADPAQPDTTAAVTR